jgi:hypothetical protein
VVEHHKPVLARGSVTGSQSIAAVRPLKLGEAGYRYVTYVERVVDQAEQCWSLSTEPRANRSTVHPSPSRYPASIVADNCRYRLLDHGMRGRKLGHSASVAFPRHLNSHIHIYRTGANMNDLDRGQGRVRSFLASVKLLLLFSQMLI